MNFKFLILIFVCLIVTGCAAKTPTGSVVTPSTVNLTPLDERTSSTPADTRIGTYNYVLQLSDFADSDLFPIGYTGKTKPIVLSDVMNDRIVKNNYLEGYIVSYGKKWNNNIKDYDLDFGQYVFSFSNESDARNAFVDLNNSLFTGRMDKLDDKPKYNYDKRQTVRYLPIRRFNVDYMKIIGVLFENNFVTYFSVIYPVSENPVNYGEILIQKIRDRLLKPLSLTKDISQNFKEINKNEYLFKATDGNITVLINNLSIQTGVNGSGILTKLIVTVINEKIYPFYPVVGYYIQQTNLSGKRSELIASQIYAKWSLYDSTLFDTNEQRTYFYLNPTSVLFDDNQTARIKIQVLDQSRGDSPFSLSNLDFIIDLHPFIHNESKN